MRVPTNVFHLRWYPLFVSLIPPILSRFSRIHMSRKQRRVPRYGTGGLAKKMFEFLALITRTVEARKRSEEVAQLRHCVCVDCRSSLKVQEQSFLPSLRLLSSNLPKRQRRSLLPRKLACLGNSPSLSHPPNKRREGEALGGPREIAPFGGHFGRSPHRVVGVAHLPLCSDD